MTTILLSTFGSYGNTAPFLQLGKELSARGHEVHLWTNFPLEGAAPSAVRIHALGGVDDYRRFTEDAGLLSRFETLPTVFRRHYLPAVEREFAGMQQFYQRGHTLIITSDAPGIAARLMSEKYGAPLISVFTYPNQLVSASLIGTLVSGPLRDEMASIRVTAGFEPHFDGAHWWRRPNRYFALWPAWFARHDDVASETTVSFSSFLYYDPEPVVPSRVESFLASSTPTVLVTGGSAGFADEAFTAAAVGAVRDCSLRCIVVTRLDLEPDRDILTVERVPSLSAVMGRVSAVIHHGGMGTIGQAIQVGIPQLVLPDGGDRPENGEIVEHLGLGRSVRRSDWQHLKLRAALKEVLNSVAIRENAALRASQVQDSSGLEGAIATIERMADRALLVESCVYTGRRLCNAPRPAGDAEGVSTKIAAMSPERRYLLLHALKSRGQ